MDQQKDLQQLGEQWERAGLKRRDFLRLAGAGASVATIAGILAACGGTPTATVGTTSSSSSSSAVATTSAAATTSSAASTTKAATTSAASSAAGGASTSSSTTSAASASSAATPRASASPAATPGGAANYPYPSGGKYSTIEPPTKKGGHVTQVDFADAKTLNPMLVSDTASGYRTAVIFNVLVDVNPDNGLPFPDLATEVPTQQNGGVSSDGKTYTFKLRKDVKWHDGQPFTSKDVVYTYTTMMKKESGSPRTSDLTDRVDSITAPDDYTVVFKLKNVVAPFLTSNMYGICPEHILGQVAPDQLKQHPFSLGDPKVTIGTGPFMFKEWVKDDHTTVVKNPNFFRGEPAIDQYVFKVVKDANVVAAQLKTGEGDYGIITAALFDEMSKQQNLNVSKFDQYVFLYYTYQLDPAKTTLFQDKAVRQALAYAIDRDAMVKAIQFGLSVVAQGTEPPPSFAYAPDQMKIKYTYDPKKAEQLLDDAGWKKGADGIRAKDGKKLQFTLWTNAGNNVRMQYITVIQQQWKQIGVDATPKTEEWNAFVSRLTEAHDYEIMLLGFSWDIDPDQSAMWTTSGYEGGFNTGKYSNPQVDKLCAEGLTTLDQEKRKQIYIDMQNILLDDLPNFITDFYQGLAAVNKRVHNLKPNAINFRWNAYTWWVEDGK